MLVAVLGFAGSLTAEEPARTDPARSGNETAPAEPPAGKADAKPEAAGKAEHKLARATFGGGCFWCSEAVFERLKGVKSVVSGYAGGRVPNPTYEMVSSGLTGHAEVVQIEYDPDVVSYETLLKVFWASHDPTTLNRQGPDFGTQYRSIILYHDEDQKAAARKMFETLTASRTYRSPIVTELVPFEGFYPAERYHQNYYRTHRGAQYSEVYITPKIKKLQKLKLK
jgi:peptide-methionine (S)-S-oxide reductase